MIARAFRGLAAATVLVVAVSSAAQAQKMASMSKFGLSAGIALPMGDFGDIADLGFDVGGHWQTGLGEKVMLRINADLSRYGLNGVDGSATLLGGMANIVLPLHTQSAFKPYLLGGVGIYNTKIDITGLGNASSSDLAINVGAGYDFMMGSKKLFTEIRYVSIQTDGSSLTTLPIVIGIRF